MLAWTGGGAVARPTTVQIRAQRAFADRVSVGAPAPSRPLSAEELLDNLRYFTVGLRGPRSAPCEAVVLSGEGVVGRPDLGEALAYAAAQGVRHVVLHASASDLRSLDARALAPRVSLLVVPAQPGPDLEAAGRALTAAQAAGLAVCTNTLLTAEALPRLADAAALLAAARPQGATLTYPFPGGATARPPHPAAVVEALGPSLAALDQAGVQVSVKGLPACQLGPHAGRLRRTANRWYVDAEHQRERALMFFPDVLAFSKGDACRFCAADGLCDGASAAWLALPGFPPLHPLDPAPAL